VITASTIAARCWSRRGIPRAATRRLNSQFVDRFVAIAERNQGAGAERLTRRPPPVVLTMGQPMPYVRLS